MSRIVLDPLAKPQLVEHFQIETGSLLDPLNLNQLVIRMKKFDTVAQLRLNGLDRA
jgi:hypothetical protein